MSAARPPAGARTAAHQGEGNPVRYGPNPWQQAHWDWRAAANFIFGGAGSGLLVFAAISGVTGLALADLIISALALIGLGLLCVWLEIGRPWRALHVFFNPHTSWMTREGLTAVLLFPCALAGATVAPRLLPLAAVLALFFLFCQGRILRASRGIPAWREPMASSLIAATGLAEGAGLFLLSTPLHQAGAPSFLILFGALLLVRALLWRVYRRRLTTEPASFNLNPFALSLSKGFDRLSPNGGLQVQACPINTHAAPRALAALDRAGRWLLGAGTLLPLVLLLAADAGAASPAWSASLGALAGLTATLAGAYLKYTLITRASFNQGFTLAQLPVRGARP